MSNNDKSKSDSKNDKSKNDLNNNYIYIEDLRKMSHVELMKKADTFGVANISGMMKQDMIMSIIRSNYESGKKIISEGVVEIMNDGFAFARSSYYNYSPSSDDMYISPNKVRKLSLKTGDIIKGEIRIPKKDERYCSLVEAITINDVNVSLIKRYIHFDSLKAIYPNKQLVLETSTPF